MSPRAHGDRACNDALTFPKVTTLANAFKQAGNQAQAVGNLHLQLQLQLQLQRDRIGFDDVILDEEGRPQWGVTDDYDIYLGDQGFAGRPFDHGMSNNQYHWRLWHLDEAHHATTWAGREMARTVKRRDPTRPSFWYLGFRHPHPLLVPPQAYIDIEQPCKGGWSESEPLPFPIQALKARYNLYTEEQFIEAKRAFYARCSPIDHQIRYLIGTLRLAGMDIPATVDGQSLFAGEREFIDGECGEDDHAARMTREDHWKLMWYPTDNHLHLLDIQNDPYAMTDLAGDSQYADTQARLQARLKSELYGGDHNYIVGDKFVGQPDRPYHWAPHRSLNFQRGDSWPPGPVVAIPRIEGTKERLP